MPGPANLTYDSLTSDIKTYLERYNDVRLADQIPRIIMYAENRLAADLRILGTKEVATSTFTPNDPVVVKPAYWRKTSSFNYVTAAGERRPLLLRDYAFLRAFWPDVLVTTGTPRYYADYNFDNFIIAGVPNAGLAFEILYTARLTPLSTATQTNWFTANAPQVLLYACLFEAEIWLKNKMNAAAREAAYNTVRDALKTEDVMRTIDTTTAVV